MNLHEGVPLSKYTTLGTGGPAHRLGSPGGVDELVEMLAQQMVGAMQSLADWWDIHRKVPREQVVQAAMDFAWVGQERISQGERWSS